MTNLCPFGTHRVLEPCGSLPQNAWKLDPSLPIRENELLISVDTLNIDSASFHQMLEESGGNPKGVGEKVLETVLTRGKQHNPVTGSGGMLLGTVAEIGPKYHSPTSVKKGQRLATLVSLSLTPLQIEEVLAVHPTMDQIDVRGTAILFPTGNFAVLPDDLPETLCLAALDVCGAPAQMPRIARQGMTVVVLGAGGKSGLLCCAALREILGSSGKLIGIERSENEPTRRLRSLNFCDELILADATSPLEVHELVSKSTQGKLADLVVNLTNVAQVEMSCILCSKPGGIVYFFSMATSFSQAALGAEGISSDSHLVIGNGFVPGAADYTLNLIRRQDRLRQHLVNFYSHQTG